jgi:hypothetical protein
MGLTFSLMQKYIISDSLNLNKTKITITPNQN